MTIDYTIYKYFTIKYSNIILQTIRLTRYIFGTKSGTEGVTKDVLYRVCTGHFLKLYN